MNGLLNFNTESKFQSQFFLSGIQADIEHINTLINQYNSSATKEQRIECLKKIYKYSQIVENKYSPHNTDLCEEYLQEITQKLYGQILDELKANGLNSIRELDENKLDIDSARPLSEIIANMSPLKMSRFLDAFIHHEDDIANILQQLHTTDEPGYAEFQEFLSKHSVSYLGGKNSKNYKITPNDGSEVFVLKIEHRCGMPRSVEAHLRSTAVSNHLIKSSLSRQVSLNVGTSSRNITITEFCGRGDLESYGNSIKGSRIESAMNFFSQMGQIIGKISQEGCAFPDMKNSNWLVDDNGQLRIADTKSFIATHDNNIDEKKLQEEDFLVVQTRFLRAPEMQTSNPYSADKAHAFMLGKNLYHHLTACDCSYLMDKDDASQLDFNHKIFATPEGQACMLLIQQTAITNPAQRLSVDEILARLASIKSLYLKNECNRILERIKGFEDQGIMKKFIDEQTKNLSGADTDEKLEAIKNQLSVYYKQHAPKDECKKMLDEIVEIDKSTYLQLKQQIDQSNSPESLAKTKAKIFEYLKPKYLNSAKKLLDHVKDEETRKVGDEVLKKFNQKINACHSIDDFNVCLEELSNYLENIQSLNSCEVLLTQISTFKLDPSNKNEYEKLKEKFDLENTNLMHLMHDLNLFLEKCKVRDIMEQLKPLGFGATDNNIKELRRGYDNLIKSAKTVEEVRGLSVSLQTEIKQLDSPVLNEVRDIIKELRIKNSSSAIQKADSIEKEFAKLSLIDRINLNDLTQAEDLLKSVMVKMAEHRLFFGKITSKADHINYKKAAQVFRRFKDKLETLKKDETELKKSESREPDEVVRPNTRLKN